MSGNNNIFGQMFCSPAMIEKWVNERKRRYPTREAVERQLKESEKLAQEIFQRKKLKIAKRTNNVTILNGIKNSLQRNTINKRKKLKASNYSSSFMDRLLHTEKCQERSAIFQCLRHIALSNFFEKNNDTSNGGLNKNNGIRPSSMESSPLSSTQPLPTRQQSVSVNDPIQIPLTSDFVRSSSKISNQKNTAFNKPKPAFQQPQSLPYIVSSPSNTLNNQFPNFYQYNGLYNSTSTLPIIYNMYYNQPQISNFYYQQSVNFPGSPYPFNNMYSINPIPSQPLTPSDKNKNSKPSINPLSLIDYE
jgi:hypothetical protein